MSPLFTLGRQSIGVSALASVLPMNIQGWFPLGLTDLISLLSKGHSRVSSSTKIWKHQLFGAHPSLWSNSHIRIWLLEKPEFWLYRPWSAKWYLCFLILCLDLSQLSFQVACIFKILCLQSSSTVILEPKKIKSVTVSTFSLFIYHEMMELDAMILVFFLMLF